MTEQQNKQNIFDSLFASDNFFNNEKSNLIRYLFILILIGVFFMLVGNLFSPETKDQKITSNNNDDDSNQVMDHSSAEERLEGQLESILSQISGAGEVMVNITLKTGPEYIYARNENDSKKKITEEDKGGGTRETEQYQNRSEIVVLNQGGTNKAVIKEKIQPKIKGVLVVAEGAQDSHVKANLIAAVKVGLGIESYKIKVLAKER